MAIAGLGTRLALPPGGNSSNETAQRPGGAMKLTPLGDRIIVRREESKGKSAGGIILPDSAKNKPQRGKVLAVGPGRLLKDGKRRGLQVKEGDSILFTNWAGDEFKDQRSLDEILVMREEDVLAVIDA
jgi:chaperonin GroES